MNKEVKELIDRLKNDSDCKDVYWVGYVDGMNCDAEITSKEINLLLDYINQLETNRDDAIEYLRYALDEEKETPSKYNDWRLDLLEIIGRSVQDETNNGS